MKQDRFSSFGVNNVWNGMVCTILGTYVCRFLKSTNKIPLLKLSLGLQNGLISGCSKYWIQNNKISYHLGLTETFLSSSFNRGISFQCETPSFKLYCFLLTDIWWPV